MGGAIGIMVAAAHPDLLGRLMVVDMTPNLGALLAPPGSPRESIRVMADQLRDGFLRVPADSATTLEQMTPSMTRNDSARAVLLQYARASHRPTLANAMHELQYALSQWHVGLTTQRAHPTPRVSGSIRHGER
jgi:pimeloyl-ACP methyl ester carboxylesterase